MDRPAFLHFLLFALIAVSAPVQAADTSSANDMERGCRLVADDQPWAGEENAIEVGRCVGVVSALLFVGRTLQPQAAFCKPRGVTVGQGIKVLLKYLDEHPGELNEPMVSMAIAAFKEAWPCQ